MTGEQSAPSTRARGMSSWLLFPSGLAEVAADSFAPALWGRQQPRRCFPASELSPTGSSVNFTQREHASVHVPGSISVAMFDFQWGQLSPSR